MYKPTLRQIEYFHKLAQLLSFQKASEACFITQSTLSNAIKELEDGLKIKLFDRTKRRVSITESGLELLQETKNLLSAQEGFLLKAEELSSTKKTTLRLGIIPTIAPFAMPRLLSLAGEKNESIELQITENLSHILIEKLEQKRLDAALLALPYPIPKTLKISDIHKDNFVLACGKTYAQKLPKALNFKSLTDLPILFLEDGHCLSDHAISSCKLKHSAKENRFYSGITLQTLMELVAQNTGVSLVPEMLIAHYSHRKDITFKTFSGQRPSRQISLIKQSRLSDAKDTFLDNLCNTALF